MDEDDQKAIEESAPDLASILTGKNSYDSKKLLGKEMLSFLCKHVGKYYFPKPDELSVKYNEQIFKKLISPICKYIANSQNYEDIFQSISKIVPGPVVCGKVFKAGQPIYSCIDCALDPTCVLCVECFKNSEHRFHDYRITRGSSGCCDCGDSEAWTNAPNCNLHIRDNSNSTKIRKELDKIFSEEDGFELYLDRMKIVFSFILDYCYAILIWSKPDQPEELCPNTTDRNPKDKCYAAILFNDETHTFEHVIIALTKAIHCDTTRATEIANIVDQSGRCLIYRGTMVECAQVATSVICGHNRGTDRPLDAKVFHIEVIAHQNFAFQLLNWLRDLLTVCEEYRILYAKHMYRANHTTSWLINIPDRFSSKTLVDKIILTDVYFWKEIRISWQKQLMNGLLIDMETKKQFARIYVRNFREIMFDYMNDDHEQSVSVVSLSVQLFTVPSITLMLIEDENVIEKILETFLDLTQAQHSNERFRFGRSQSETFQFRRIMSSFDSLTYILDRTIEPDTWTTNLRKNFILGFKTFLSNLKLMQSIDSVVRKIDRHIEFEPSLENGMHLQMSLSPIMKSMSFWASTDPFVYDNCFRALLQKFYDYFNSENPQIILRSAGSESCDCYEYDVSTREVSFHIPLSRLISHFCMYLSSFETKFDLPKTLEDIGLNFHSLIEHPLRVQVLISQFRSGMWRRNGTSLANHLMYMQISYQLRESTLDADYILLQICAAYMNPNHYLIAVLNKYSLNFLVDDSDHDPKDDEEIHQLNQMIEEFFKLIYVLLVERYVRFIGNIIPEDIIKYETIQWLCVSPMSNSKLKSYLNQSKGVNLDEQILQVAEFKKPKNSTKHGEYQLMERFYPRFNPFFYRFSRQDQELAHVEQVRRQRSKGDKYVCCPPPELPEFAKGLEKISNLLICDVMFGIVKKILIKTCDLTDNLFSDSHFQHVLYILGLGLREQEKRPKEFKFVEKCSEWGFLALLEQCNSRHILPRIEAHQNLLGWTFDKFKEVQQLSEPAEMSSTEAMDIDEGSSSTQQKDGELKALRKLKALKHRDAIVAKMKVAQINFLKDNEEFLKDSSSKSDNSSSVSMNDLTGIDTPKINDEIALGSHQDISSRLEYVNKFEKQDFTCILCLETHQLQSSEGLMIAVAFCQKSSVISFKNDSQPSKSKLFSSLFIDSDLNNLTYASGCGHWFHYRCFHEHLDQQKVRDRSRTLSRPKRNYDEKKGEFICPMCKTICNLMIPIMSPTKLTNDCKFVDYSMLDWLSDMHFLASGSLIGLDFALTPAQLTELNDILCSKIESLPQLKNTFNEYHSQRQTNFLKACTVANRGIILDVVLRCSQTIFQNTLPDTLEPENQDDYEIIPSDLKHLNSLYQTISNTIQVFERCQRQNVLTFIKIKDSIQFTCIRSLVELAKVQLQFYSNVCPKRQSLFTMKYLLDSTFYQTISRSILDVDAFGLFVSLLFTIPSLFSHTNINPSDYFITSLGNSVEHNCFLLMFTFHLVQIVLTNANICDPEELDQDDMDTGEKMETNPAPPDQNLAQICVDILTAAGHQFDRDTFIKNCTLVSDRIREKMLPFLRCAAMFGHFFTGVSFPKRLLEESKDVSFIEHGIVSQEFETLCNYLGISSGLCFLGISNLKNVALSWAKHSSIRTYFYTKNENDKKQISILLKEHKFLVQPHSIKRLVTLPRDFSELINSIAYFKCPSSGLEAKFPTMCLVCGDVLCSQNYCCQEKQQKDMLGSCMKHILNCGKGSGIFIRIRECKIMLLIPNRGRFLPAPYLDKYGETDQGLKRGSPLFLSNDSFQKLNEIWMRHQIPEQIVQYLEFYNGFTSILWNMM